jgi:hypothetical protein
MSQTACFPSLPLRYRYTSGEHDPLHDFYIPVLRLARRYDRAAGYFSSNAFVVAAQGVAHLIAHVGTMRLLVGAQLSPEDAEAIRRGEEERERVLAAALARWLPDPQALADRGPVLYGQKKGRDGVFGGAVYEMAFVDDVPPRVSIDEAVEMGKRFGSEDSAGFINGVLDNIYNTLVREGRIRDDGT